MWRGGRPCRRRPARRRRWRSVWRRRRRLQMRRGIWRGSSVPPRPPCPCSTCPRQA
uniref:Uncharacterized protein n=1 Tax=Arundo donax TaxID=35708 RepID=A0A0A9FQE9_ARUDO